MSLCCQSFELRLLIGFCKRVFCFFLYQDFYLNCFLGIGLTIPVVIHYLLLVKFVFDPCLSYITMTTNYILYILFFKYMYQVFWGFFALFFLYIFTEM